MWKVTLDGDRLVFTPFFGDPAADQDPDHLREELQDLKLENDRMRQRNELMEDYIHAVACVKSEKSKFYSLCETSNCRYYDHDKDFGQGACTLSSRDLIEQEAANLIEELEEIG